MLVVNVIGPWTPAQRQRVREYFTEGLTDLLEDWTPPGHDGVSQEKTP